MLVHATELKPGNLVLLADAVCVVKSVDVSKTGKHGASKVRIEAIGVLDKKKRILVMPGSERVEIPYIEKRKAQVLSVNKEAGKASLMDLESYESFEAELFGKIPTEGSQVEYLIIKGKKIVK